jgi:hypothetical protein
MILTINSDYFFLADRILHQDYYRKGSVEKKKDLWSWSSRDLTLRIND